MLLGLHPIDLLVLAGYFALVIYLGVYLGGKKTKTLGDFFVAGGKWGSLVSFIFVFASALAGNEAVVVSSAAYGSGGTGVCNGLSGFWLWGNFLFATPIYFLFATYYRRARVYNLAEFLEMRYGSGVAAFYALVAGVICLLFIGMFLYAVAVILAGALDLHVQVCVWSIAVIVAAYIFSGGMMSTLLTDLLQGVMCLFILGFLMLPFLWSEAGGLEALRSLPPETWDFTGPNIGLAKVAALCLSTLAGGIAAPWIYNWIAVSKNEKAATQCAWAHLWKRVVTLVFTLYGILFFLIMPELQSPELAWGKVMQKTLPVGAIGLMLASFFAAAMSSAATYATTSAAMLVDYCYRKIVLPGRPRDEYLMTARWFSMASILIAAASTLVVSEIEEYVKLCLLLLCFLGIPIYFGVVWRRANQLGMWMSLALGVGSFVVIRFGLTGVGKLFPSSDDAFVAGVFTSTTLSLVGMLVGTWLGAPEDEVQLKRFFVIMNTPIGQEHRLVEADIHLPSLVDAGLVDDQPEQLRLDVLDRLYAEDAQHKIFGAESSIEVRNEPGLGWYFPGFLVVTAACIGLVAATWLITRILFVWPAAGG